MSFGPELLNTRLRDVLRSSLNSDGGWGYYPGKVSRLEPTCWALLGLLDAGAEDAGDGSRVNAALTLLTARQNRNGLITDVPGALPNFAFNGLAAVVIHHAASSRWLAPGQGGPDLSALLSSIVNGVGVRSGRSWINRQDNKLNAWPWHDGTSNWVEPTAWCMLALKKTAQASADARAASRLADADRMLADRCCLGGGWNYGNSNMLGKELSPYVCSSALALLALQDRPALPEVARSIEWLAGNWHSEPSSLALSLARIAMHVHRRPARDLERALHAYLASVEPSGNLATCGLTLYALNGSRHGYAAFSL